MHLHNINFDSKHAKSKYLGQKKNFAHYFEKSGERWKISKIGLFDITQNRESPAEIGELPYLVMEFIYLIGKNFVGKKWRNFRQVTKIFTDEIFCRLKFSPTNYFYRRIFFADENFKIVLFCNNFSCISKVLGRLRPKSTVEIRFITNL